MKISRNSSLSKSLSKFSLTFIITCVFSLIFITSTLSTNSSSTGFNGGQGTLSDPYQVSNARELNNVRYHLDASFIQVADIDLSSSEYNNIEYKNRLKGWVPIGLNEGLFTGDFDGNGFEIKGMNIEVYDRLNVGLFSKNEGVLINIKLTDFKVNAFDKYDLAEKNPKDQNVTNSQEWWDSWSSIGGLVGLNKGHIKFTDASGSIENELAVNGLGGIAGVSNGNIVNTNIKIDIKGKRGVYGTGGLVGMAGGAVINSSSNILIEIESIGGNIGGLIGTNYDRLKISDSSSKGQIILSGAGSGSGSPSSDGYIGGFMGDSSNADIENSSADVYILNKQERGHFIGGFVGLAANSVNILNSYSTGDIDIIASAGRAHVGGFAGKSFGDVTIHRSYSTGNITNYDPGNANTIQLGGFIGSLTIVGSITECFALGNVEGYGMLGGFAGWVGIGYSNSDNYIIQDNYALGNVHLKGEEGFAGGFFGGFTIFERNDSVAFNNLYSAGHVSSSGDTSNDDMAVGGFIGELRAYDLENIDFNSFWDKETSMQSNAVGEFYPEKFAQHDFNITGLSTDKMQKKNTFLEKNWNFSTIWNIKEGETYPFFKWFGQPTNVDPSADNNSTSSLEDTQASSRRTIGSSSNTQESNQRPANPSERELADSKPSTTDNYAITLGASIVITSSDSESLSDNTNSESTSQEDSESLSNNNDIEATPQEDRADDTLITTILGFFIAIIAMFRNV